MNAPRQYTSHIRPKHRSCFIVIPQLKNLSFTYLPAFWWITQLVWLLNSFKWSHTSTHMKTENLMHDVKTNLTLAETIVENKNARTPYRDIVSVCNRQQRMCVKSFNFYLEMFSFQPSKMVQGIDEAVVTFQHEHRTETWQRVNMLLFSASNSLNPVEYKAVKWLSLDGFPFFL